MEYLTEEESSLLQQVSQVAETLIARSDCGKRNVVGTGKGGLCCGHAKVPAQPRGAPTSSPCHLQDP